MTRYMIRASVLYLFILAPVLWVSWVFSEPHFVFLSAVFWVSGFRGIAVLRYWPFFSSVDFFFFSIWLCQYCFYLVWGVACMHAGVSTLWFAYFLD